MFRMDPIRVLDAGIMDWTIRVAAYQYVDEELEKERKRQEEERNKGKGG